MCLLDFHATLYFSLMQIFEYTITVFMLKIINSSYLYILTKKNVQRLERTIDVYLEGEEIEKKILNQVQDDKVQLSLLVNSFFRLIASM